QSMDQAKEKQVRDLFESAKSSDYTQCELVRPSDWTPRSTHSLELVLACKQAPRTQYVARLFKALFVRNLHLGSFRLTFVNPQHPERILLVVANIQGKDGASCWECTDVEELMQELVSVRDFACEDLFEETFVRQAYGNGQLVSFLRSASCFV